MNKLLKILIYAAAVSIILLGLMTVIFNIPKRFENELMNNTKIEKVETVQRLPEQKSISRVSRE
ncbi:MAG: hypothetical protein HQ557_16140 [Bacteroidetes bacterium]|nr:hypothetical protein [Bacteroidota bacterium]